MENMAIRIQLLIMLLTCAVVLSSGVTFCLAAESKAVRISPLEMDVAQSLKNREQAVEAREKALNEKEEELTALQKEVDEKLTRLVALQDDIQAQLDQLVGVQSKEFKNLIKIYSTMSSSKLAPMLNKMSDGEVVKILRAMKAELVAKVMPKLDQDKAVQVSKLMGMLETPEMPQASIN